MSQEHFLGRILTWPFLGEDFPVFWFLDDFPFPTGTWCQTWDTSPGWKQRTDTHSLSPQSECPVFMKSCTFPTECPVLMTEKLQLLIFRYYSVKKRAVWPGSKLSPIVTNIHKTPVCCSNQANGKLYNCVKRIFSWKPPRLRRLLRVPSWFLFHWNLGPLWRKGR